MITARQLHTLAKVRAPLLAAQLLVIDDLFLRRLPVGAGDELADILMSRYEKASTIVTSNRPIDDWATLLGDVVVVAPLLDRLMHHGHLLKFDGKSWRLKEAAERDCTPGRYCVKAKLAPGGVEPDLVGRDSSGSLRLFDFKASETASLTKNQRTGYPATGEFGALVERGGGLLHPAGLDLPPTEVTVYRPSDFTWAGRLTTGARYLGTAGLVYGLATDAISLDNQFNISRQTGDHSNTIDEGERIAGGYAGAYAVGGSFAEIGGTFGFVVGGPFGAAIGTIGVGLKGGTLGYLGGGYALPRVIGDVKKLL